MDKTIRVWRMQDRQCVRTIQDSDFSIHSILVGQQDDCIFAAGGDNSIRKYSVREGYKAVATMNGHTNEVFSLCFNRGSTIVYSAGLDMSIKGWNSTTGALINNFEGHQEGVTVAILDHKEIKMASGSMDNSIKIWDLD